MLAKLARLGVLAAAGVLSIASTSSQGRSPQYPYRPGPSYASASAAPMAEAYYCALIRTPSTQGTLCVATLDRCERERRAAAKDGAETAPCQPQAPVSCFQLGGDPNPSMEMCGATAEDCDLWRLIDQDQNGRTGGPCDWRHGDLGAPPPR
jgi:hypothetical protein